jgi:hypothetical protein
MLSRNCVQLISWGKSKGSSLLFEGSQVMWDNQVRDRRDEEFGLFPWGERRWISRVRVKNTLKEEWRKSWGENSWLFFEVVKQRSNRLIYWWLMPNLVNGSNGCFYAVPIETPLKPREGYSFFLWEIEAKGWKDFSFPWLDFLPLCLCDRVWFFWIVPMMASIDFPSQHLSWDWILVLSSTFTFSFISSRIRLPCRFFLSLVIRLLLLKSTENMKQLMWQHILWGNSHYYRVPVDDHCDDECIDSIGNTWLSQGEVLSLGFWLDWQESFAVVPRALSSST